MLLIRFWGHISSSRKRQLVLVMILMLVTTFAEVVSIGAVIPFIAVLENPEAVFQYENAQYIIAIFGINEPEQLFLPFTVLFSVAAVLAGLMRLVLLWVQTRLGHAIGADVSVQIYKRTLYQSYLVHVARNSSEVVAGISTKVDQVVSQTVLPVLYMISSLFMLSVILATLVMISPIMALSIMIGFSFIYALFVLVVRNRLVLNSQSISNKTNMIVKVLMEGIGGIRDVLLDGTQSTYCQAFRSADLPRRRAAANNQIMGLSPRYIVESFAMVLIAGVAYFFGARDGNLVSVLPVLGALAVGAQRMLPMLQQVYSSWSQIGGSQAILQDVLQLLEQPLPSYSERSTAEPIVFQQSIKLEKISFRYKDDAGWILKDVDLVIPKGAKIGFIGSTGSGKSTLLDIFMALLHPTEGALLIDGVRIGNDNHRGWQSQVSHIPQSIFLSDATIAENVAFGVPQDQIDLRLVEKVAQHAQIAETIETWDDKYQTMVGERGVRLSGGQRQRIGIARALYKQADVLILDEATSALDNATEKAVMDAIHDEYGNITILMVAHRLSTLEDCDIVIELEDGAIIRQGMSAEII